ncbi:MAG TPA: head GIN domain-containing protein [Anaerolineales bacterium]|nr:head GIN domain-containing protein [Anaerolineales bacterium]
MNINKFLLPSLLIFAALLSTSCSVARGRGLAGGIPGSGNIQTQTRDTGAFQAISIEYPGAKIIIQQGLKESVEIQADDNLLPQLSTEVLAGRLSIKSSETNWKTSVNPSKQVKITITARDLNEILLSAEVGDLEVNDLQAGTLKLVLSGGAQIKLNGIQVDLLDSDLSGAGDIQASGIANEIKLILSGFGNFNAADLKSDKATIELSGMGNATVRVEKELAATITGAGSVNYLGNPRVDKTLNGAGSVKPAE